MTKDEFRPIAARLARASLTLFPPSPAGESSKFDEWSRALLDLDAEEVDAAVTALIAHRTEPIGQPGIIREKVMVLRPPRAPASSPRVEYGPDGGRVYRCRECKDTGWMEIVDGLGRILARRCACSPQAKTITKVKRKSEPKPAPFEQSLPHRKDVHA